MNETRNHITGRIILNAVALIVLGATIYQSLTSRPPVTQPPAEFSTQKPSPQPPQKKPISTAAAFEPPPETPKHPSYKLTPVLPLEGQQHDYAINVQQCFRSSDRINCWGYVTNTTDGTLSFRLLTPGEFVDDEGNSSWYNGTLRNNVQLIPDTPIKFELSLNDSHRSVKSVSFQLATDVEGDTFKSYHVDRLSFRNIPVQSGD